MHWGGVLAGPVFKKVMEFVLQNQRVSPTAETKTFYSLTEAALRQRDKITPKSGA